jgi:hypothetical protein
MIFVWNPLLSKVHQSKYNRPGNLMPLACFTLNCFIVIFIFDSPYQRNRLSISLYFYRHHSLTFMNYILLMLVSPWPTVQNQSCDK